MYGQYNSIYKKKEYTFHNNIYQINPNTMLARTKKGRKIHERKELCLGRKSQKNKYLGIK